jgi:uncharacterized protein (TIGR02594 family)
MIMDTRDSAAEPGWMPVAIAERGVRRFPVGETNPRIVEYNNQTNLAGYDDKISWCSSFINWCLASAGVRGTRSALARSWLDWGVALESPIYGCVTVLTRDDPTSWKGHVGFYLRHDDKFIYLLGGNQLDEVRELAYPVASVLGYRWPESCSDSSVLIESTARPGRDSRGGRRSAG